MADTDFRGFTAQSTVADTDTLIGVTSAGGGVNYPGSAFVKKIADNDFQVRGSGALPRLSFWKSGVIWHLGNPDLGSGNEFKIWLNAIPAVQVTTDVALAPGTDNRSNLGVPSLRWKTIYATTGSISTSDAREKQQIGPIPDEWLGAWADVEWCRFKFNTSVAEKGDAGARWHTGLVAQQVRDAFAAHGLDAAEIGLIGLLCHDEWDGAAATPEVVNEDGDVVQPAQPATEGGDRWGLRYEECEAMEAAYQRRRMAAIEARLAVLEGAAG